MRLIEALRYSGQAHLALVGAGGKTSALFQIAGELLAGGASGASPRSVLVTTTTHLGTWQAERADHLAWIKSDSDLSQLEDNLPAGIILLLGEQKGNRLTGLAPKMLEQVRRYAEEQRLPLIIEADGANRRALKAPGQHEPAIPVFVNIVVVVAGLGGLGKPLTDLWVHRPELFARLSQLSIGENITPEAISRVLRNESGGLKNIPPEAHTVLLLNQADTLELQSLGEEIARQLIPLYDKAIIASLAPGVKALIDGKVNQNGSQPVIYEVIEPIAGIVLAAGSSTRFGAPKQLLDWQGQPLVRHVAATAIMAGLAPVEVVVGSSAAEVSAFLADLPLRIVNNPTWMEGLSTSIKLGIKAITEYIGGAIFLHADQPQVPLQLIKSLLQAHQRNLSPIVAPRINGKRSTPVLFDARVLPDFQSLQGDRGGRDLFEKFDVTWVDWGDPETSLDIDTPEDYRKFLELRLEQNGSP